jgi:hypothetical protein
MGREYAPKQCFTGQLASKVVHPCHFWEATVQRLWRGPSLSPRADTKGPQSTGFRALCVCSAQGGRARVRAVGAWFDDENVFQFFTQPWGQRCSFR